VVPYGQHSIAWFSVVALAGMGVLAGVGRWYRRRLAEAPARKAAAHSDRAALPTRTVAVSLAVLIALVFSKYFYMASLTSYYALYLMEKFALDAQQANIYLFVFLGAVAVGTFGGGPIGDRFGFKTVIWGSILGVLPFTLALPYANLFWTVALSVPIGVILASAFSAIVVYAQELTPNRVGMIAGLFFGLAFGMSGLGAAVLGYVADQTSLEYVYGLCAYLPLIGLLTVFLPDLRRDSQLAP
ncbi:MAG TPA: MFS transporter, partial [Pirellulales bacterium]